MNIIILGAGPAGLYSGLLIKKSIAQLKVIYAKLPDADRW